MNCLLEKGVRETSSARTCFQRRVFVFSVAFFDHSLLRVMDQLPLSPTSPTSPTAPVSKNPTTAERPGETDLWGSILSSTAGSRSVVTKNAIILGTASPPLQRESCQARLPCRAWLLHVGEGDARPPRAP